MTDKSVLDFKDGQFLQIMAAESEGLVTVEARVEKEKELLLDMQKNIKSDYFSNHAEKWNEERVKIADYVAKGILFDQTVKWLKETLRLNAIDYVTNMCKIKLEKKLDMAPFRPIQDDDEFIDDTPATVMALSWGEGDRSSPTQGVVIDSNGRLNHHFVLPKLGDRDREQDMDRFSEKVGIYEPDIIAIAGFHPGIQTHLLQIVKEIVAKGRAKRKWEKEIVVTTVDDDVARIFMNSNRGNQLFPEANYPPLVKYLVSLARKVQDPVIEYAGLVNRDDDIKHLQLHPLQKLIPEDKLKKAIERSFMNVISIW